MIEALAGTGRRASGLESTAGEHGRSQGPFLRSAGLAALLQGIALMAIVAWDGTAWWRVTRVAAVAIATAAVVSLQHRGGPRLAMFVAWVWGAIGVAVGLGIGLVHVLRAGLSLYAALGLVCLFTGIIATARVIFGLSHRMRGWRRLVVFFTAPAALVLVYYPLTVALIATDPPRVDIGSARPSGSRTRVRGREVRDPRRDRNLGLVHARFKRSSCLASPRRRGRFEPDGGSLSCTGPGRQRLQRFGL